MRIVAVRFSPSDWGVHRLGTASALSHDAIMKTDILIAGLMVTFSVTALVAIIWTVAYAIREEPRSNVKSPETAPVLRPVLGW